jgi:hypothetical protein
MEFPTASINVKSRKSEAMYLDALFDALLTGDMGAVVDKHNVPQFDPSTFNLTVLHYDVKIDKKISMAQTVGMERDGQQQGQRKGIGVSKKLFALALLCAVSLSQGCSSDVEKVRHTVIPAQISGTAIPEDDVERVRYGEDLKAYTLGRYVDPSNSNIMYEPNTLYRVEESSYWNVRPNGKVGLPMPDQPNRKAYLANDKALVSEFEAAVGEMRRMNSNAQKDEVVRGVIMATQKQEREARERLARLAVETEAKARKAADEAAATKKELLETIDELKRKIEALEASKAKAQKDPFAFPPQSAKPAINPADDITAEAKDETPSPDMKPTPPRKPATKDKK